LTLLAIFKKRAAMHKKKELHQANSNAPRWNFCDLTGFPNAKRIGTDALPTFMVSGLFIPY
jgi:hypothetical protein